ncbi:MULTISPECIES: hypothetical protein [Planococcus]|uniref:Uncharacterized protein n=1 Tax=Planococcus versutus TaxID=1302659 RepID=A0A1B1S5W2_9BACL|nr:MULTISPECIES: hypothetical protein [Planococcus]ANU28565.1 hypothetical protein I858_016415 [Planococcus versutus]MDJ0332676.1 hypothetical protein [Planococcus sp. S3-L1]
MVLEKSLERNHSLKIMASRAHQGHDINDVGALVLKKEDVLNFGESVKGDDVSYSLENQFKMTFQKIINENKFDARKLEFIYSGSKVVCAYSDLNTFPIPKLPALYQPCLARMVQRTK